ncbi:DET1.2 family protein [Megaselia abdita]
MLIQQQFVCQFTSSKVSIWNIFKTTLKLNFLNSWKRTVKGQNGQPNVAEIAKRILAQLPVSAQSYSYSAYLDLGVFSYDDKSISVLERPKNCGENPIAFFSRDSGRLVFRITPSIQESPRGIVAFIIHPYEPFIISVHRTRGQDYTINFHLRNQNSIYKFSAKNTSEI